MPPFDMTIYCSHPDYRDRPATYKIAATWNGGDYAELKTYGFADDESVGLVFRQAQARLAKLRPADGEQVGDLCIFCLDSNRKDCELERARDLEDQLRKHNP